MFLAFRTMMPFPTWNLSACERIKVDYEGNCLAQCEGLRCLRENRGNLADRRFRINTLGFQRPVVQPALNDFRIELRVLDALAIGMAMPMLGCAVHLSWKKPDSANRSRVCITECINCVRFPSLLTSKRNEQERMLVGTYFCPQTLKHVELPRLQK